MIVLHAHLTLAQATDKTPKAVIEKMSSELDAIISTDAEVETIASGFEWVEGPVWVESQKMLLFSDIFKNRIYKWTAAKGKELYLEPSGYSQKAPRGGEIGSNGLAVNSKGQLVLCQHGDRQIAIMNAALDHPKPVFITLANQYDGKKFNSPNDLAIKSNGDIYFTDPPYGLEKGVEDPAKELPYQGVYKISKEGTVTLLIDSLTRPNGIAFFPGEKSLLIANSDAKKPYWYIYDLDKKRGLINGRIFFDGSRAFQKENRSPDGIKIDRKGRVFAPGPGGIWIYNEKGMVLGRIKINVITSNCAFSADYKTLFITADSYVLKVDLK
ncbi:gluconolactonase [Olivibacter domesticus]|uniref:Gluconolactonase n=2 Tax=Olivibacter domesticus TaxID=407022 RepID=A0A1H7MRS3_OLID1|nr:gluconolactonase [Olivibacter domesticus]